MAALLLAVPLIGILAAYGFALTTVKFTPGGLAAAAGVIGITGTGLLYAWRAVSGASVE
jgi:hypothetical protein